MRGKDESGEGRLPEKQEQDVSRGRDISEIDCQEGTMERGETGGNFQELDSNKKAEHEKNPQ
jgi:hypothetical protein